MPFAVLFHSNLIALPKQLKLIHIYFSLLWLRNDSVCAFTSNKGMVCALQRDPTDDGKSEQMLPYLQKPC